MTNSFVLNLDRNLQSITAEDESTTMQIGEFIIKGTSEHVTAEEHESFNIYLEVPAELFRYAANVLQEPASKLRVNYNALLDEDTVTLEFTADEGGSPK